MKPSRAPQRFPTTESNNNKQLTKNHDPVKVYCRIRPLPSDSDLSCIRILSATTIVITPPETAVNYKLGAQKEIQYIFERVFQANATQREVYENIAQPLVEDLIRGKNGLLFSYGVTGSGKTYTMTGDLRDRGIMPRCLDELFKTISDYQTKKYVFKSDRLNGFEILSDADAMLERQTDMNSRFAKPKRKESDPEIASQASTEPKCLGGVDEDNMYAVFVTYIEIYNNSVYDLLEDGNVQKTLQSKIIREDANHNMYVHGVTEIEIKSVEEAIDAFQTGQKRKRMGHTILNAESSRSHSVFTIRLVQAPTDNQGENLVQDKRAITISQLSLVDLAGSERTNRTKNTGQRLREAGNINNSLMNLRICLEYLRENQLTGSNKKIPYRDSKITHFFKNYFDGEGKVAMIVCVNPRAEDYDENTQVMRFAEMTQEVQIAKSIPTKFDTGLTPGRRKANKMFKAAINNLYDLGYKDVKKLEIDLSLVYSLDNNFPEYHLDTPESNQVVIDLMKILEQRIQKRKLLLDDLNARFNNFRLQLMEMDKQNALYKTDNASFKAVLNLEKKKTQALESKLNCYEYSIDELNRKLNDRDDLIKELEKQLNQKQIQLSKKEIEKEKQKKKYATKIAIETDKMNRELETKLLEQRNKHHEKLRLKEEQIKRVKDIINTDKIEKLQPITIIRSNSSENLITNPKTLSAARADLYYTPTAVKNLQGIPVANIRHRRSKSEEKWLEHRAPNPVPLGTILQPYLKNRKSITKLTDVKDLTSRTSKYCLVSQEADTNGDVETKLYKGNVIPTCGGGAQVVFDDVECLKQTSPVSSPNRKRPSNSNGITELPISEEIASRCTMSMEGHSAKKPKI